MTLQQYEAAYSLIGTIYGGNGSSNFMLPNLQGRALIGCGVSPASGHQYLHGTFGGTENVTTGVVGSVTLTTGNVPVGAHNHPASFTPVTGPQNVTIPAIPATPGTPPSITSATLQANPSNTGNSNIVSSSNSYLASSPAGNAGTTMWATAAGAAPVNVGGLSVALNPGTPGSAAIPAQTVSITSVTNGSVSVGANTGGNPSVVPVNASNIPVMQPYLVMDFIIAMNGLYPDRP